MVYKKDRMIFKRQVYRKGGSLAITIPIEVAEFLSIDEGKSVGIITDMGKYGKFAAFWKHKEDEE